MRIGLAQINPTVGDIAGNAELILDRVKEAEQNNCALVLFPELSLTGYPPEDLLLKPAFIKDNLTALKDLAHLIKKTIAVIGFVDSKNGKNYNAAAWVEKGRIKAVYHKQELPNYGVFDEKRYFEPGRKPCVQRLGPWRIGLTICEDIWVGKKALEPLKKLKPHIAINISASPFHVGKLSTRHTIGINAAAFLKAPVIYCNLVGGQDELVFDGASFVAGPNGKILAQAPQFKDGLFVIASLVAEGDRAKRSASTRDSDWKLISQRQIASVAPAGLPRNDRTAEIHEALILGLRDYVRKNKFEKVALGISGGIDSALVAALAAEALGPENVVGITMPSQFNSKDTVNDSRQLAANLGITFHEIAIKPVFDLYQQTLAPLFSQTKPNIAEENLQARVRGTLLMAVSNKFGWLILTTGNKSEISTGYCTLYGDTAGGFAVLKDVLKTTVYDLARFINKKAGRAIIPQSIIDRPPTAELRANQKDEDSLGKYADLDPIIVGYVENNKSLDELKKQLGQDASYIKKTISLIDRSEYKRRQAPPGIKITPRAFGRDHRMPMTNRYNPS